MKSDFTIEVGGAPDREELVAELWLGPEQVAELSQDGGVLRLYLYPPRFGGHWEFEYESFVEAIGDMKRRLALVG